MIAVRSVVIMQAHILRFEVLAHLKPPLKSGGKEFYKLSYAASNACSTSSLVEYSSLVMASLAAKHF